jgi:hypothetical protein
MQPKCWQKSELCVTPYFSRIKAKTTTECRFVVYAFWVINFLFKLQKEFPTIEGHLLTALRLYGIINEEQEQKPFGFYFQRAARTDRAVSAVRQVNLTAWKVMVQIFRSALCNYPKMIIS